MATNSTPPPTDPAAVVRQMVGVFRPVTAALVTSVGRFTAAMKPLADWAEQHPEALAHWQAQRESEALLGSCHCLCGTHRERAQGVCTGVASVGLTVHFNSPTIGPTDVPMCRPCYETWQTAAA